MRIVVADPSTPQLADLLHAHLEQMRSVTPLASVHALDLAGLGRPEVTLWAAMDGEVLVGCAALKELDSHHGEIKSMRTAPSHQRRGVASRLLQHLISEARRRGYARLSLETGSFAFFAPARRLYAAHGFEYAKPFAGYREDPNSVFMTREIG